MRTVAAAIKEDLGRVKDALDLYTRKGGPPEELAPATLKPSASGMKTLARRMEDAIMY